MVQRLAAQHGFTITRPYGMAYIPEFGVYTYAVRGSNDIRGEGWDTSIWIDGNTGALRDVSLPSGQHTGNTISTLLWGLHYGDIRNFLVYRILVSFFGVAPHRDLGHWSLHLVEKTHRQEARSLPTSADFEKSADGYHRSR